LRSPDALGRQPATTRIERKQLPPEVSLIASDGKKSSLASLKASRVIDVISTSCASTCPILT